MLHHVGKAKKGRVLFFSWSEARSLWDRLVLAAPGLIALVLMPDHFHLLHAVDVRLRLAHALSGYTRWLNGRRDSQGPLVDPLPAPERITGSDKERRQVRYLHLNPTRARLCNDPLGWPFSTHRDAVGLAPFPVIPAHRDPVGFHAYVSGDPTVRVEGTELPAMSLAVPDVASVLHAVSAVTRTPLLGLRDRGAARSLAIRAARTLTPAVHGEIARVVGVSRWTVVHSPVGEDARVRAVARAAGDPRFAPLWDDDLRTHPTWRWYSGRR